MPVSRSRGTDIVRASVDDRALAMALRKFPKELKRELRQENRRLAERVAGNIKTEISTDVYGPPQADLIAKAVYPKADTVVRVDVGGSKMVGWKYVKVRGYNQRGGAAAGKLLFGAERGSSGKAKDRSGRTMGRRFVAPHKADGYWLKQAVDSSAPDVIKEWRRIAARYCERVS